MGDEVNSKLQTIISREYNNVHDIMESKSVDMRTGAYILALKRIGQAVAAHGTQSYFANGE